MNRKEILVLKIRQISKHNIKCFNVCCELLDAGREDLLNEIIKAMNVNYQLLTPEQIVRTYEQCGGRDGFIARCNKIWNKKTIARERKEYEYEEELKRYNCGEQNYHPDGTKFDSNGKEIHYD